MRVEHEHEHEHEFEFEYNQLEQRTKEAPAASDEGFPCFFLTQRRLDNAAVSVVRIHVAWLII